MTQVADPQELLLNLLDPSNRADPYPAYERIREGGPLQVPSMTLTVFSSYADCEAVLRHPSSSADALNSTALQRRVAQGAPSRPFGTPGFLFLDPPDHTRLRRLVSKAFVPNVVTSLEPGIAAMVDTLLDAAGGAGRFDVISDLAYPLPMAVICRLLGVPVLDEPLFRRASALLAQSLDPVAAITGQSSQNVDEVTDSGLWLRQYLRDLITRRRADPGDDLMSALIEVEESGDQLTEDEIVATCDLLLVAGHETTVNLIANAALAMLRGPNQWAALGADPWRVSMVIEETLRYDPPVQLASRIATADMVIGDTFIDKGDIMMLLLAAAQRDPAAVDRPANFDPDRETIRHLGFGRGAHFCLGAPLARLEASVALTKLTARFPSARIIDEPQYKSNLTLRGMSSLAVTF